MSRRGSLDLMQTLQRGMSSVIGKAVPSLGSGPSTPEDGLFRAGSSDKLGRLASATCGVATMAEGHECITVFFSDLVGFSTWASNLPPERVRE